MSSRVIRIACDSETADNRESVSGSPVSWFEGNALEFQLGFFNNSSLITDFSQWLNGSLEIKSANADNSTPPLFSAIFSAGSINDSLTVSDWGAGVASHQTVYVSSTASSHVGSGLAAVTVRLLTSDGDELTFRHFLAVVKRDLAGRTGIDGTVYRGLWNAAENMPALNNATGSNSERYQVSVAGTHNLGAGAESYLVGDEVIHNGLTWEKLRAGISREWMDSVFTPAYIGAASQDDIDDLSAIIVGIQAAQTSGRIAFQTKALMDADLDHDEDTLAEVTNDGTAASNGTYIKVGASGAGSWLKSTVDLSGRVTNLELTKTQTHIEIARDSFGQEPFIGAGMDIIPLHIGSNDKIAIGLENDTGKLFASASQTLADSVKDILAQGVADLDEINIPGVGLGALDPNYKLVTILSDGGHTQTSATRNASLTQGVAALSAPTLVGDAGAWTYFTDERAIVFANGNMLIGAMDGEDTLIWHFNATSGVKTSSNVSSVSEYDDHNNPSLTVLPTGKILAMYQTHGDTHRRWRVSLVDEPVDISDWGAEQTQVTSTASYSNPVYLSTEGAHYNISRDQVGSNSWKWLKSTDNGTTWSAGGRLHYGTFTSNCYPRVCSNGTDKIYVLASEAQPYDNGGIYAYYISNNSVYQMDGTLISALPTNDATSIKLTTDLNESGIIRPYREGQFGMASLMHSLPSGEHWAMDCALDSEDRMCILFSVSNHKDDDSYPWRQDTDRIFYYWGIYNPDLHVWHVELICNSGYAMSGNSARYPAGCALDPANPHRVVVSTNCRAPFDFSRYEVPLSDTKQFELWQGDRAAGGDWMWRPLTEDSAETTEGYASREALGHFRPVIVDNPSGDTSMCVWFAGAYLWWEEEGVRPGWNTRLLAKELLT